MPVMLIVLGFFVVPAALLFALRKTRCWWLPSAMLVVVALYLLRADGDRLLAVIAGWVSLVYAPFIGVIGFAESRIAKKRRRVPSARLVR